LALLNFRNKAGRKADFGISPVQKSGLTSPVSSIKNNGNIWTNDGRKTDKNKADKIKADKIKEE
jgi:hypothetical protein